MKRSIPFVTVLVAMLIAGIAPAQVPFEAVIDGAQEVPPVATTGSGFATGSLSGGPGSWVFNYSVNFQELIGTTTVAHIHEAPVGVPGPVRHDLDNFPVGVTTGAFAGDWRFDDAGQPLTDALAASLLAGNMYINIHSTFRPGGEIRGQLLVVPEPATAGVLLLGATGLMLRRRR